MTGYDSGYDSGYDGGAALPVDRPGRPALLGDPDHGALAGDLDHGANEGYIPTAPVNPPTPPRPALLGDPEHGALAGDPDYGANEGFPPLPIPAQLADDGISVVLERPDGRTWASETAGRVFRTSSIDVTLEANGQGDYKVGIPYVPGLERWGFSTIHLGVGGERIFRGQLKKVDTPESDDAITTLSGPGPLGRMEGDDYTVTYDVGEASYYDEALQQFLAEYAPDQIRFRVVTPSDRHRVPLPSTDDDGGREFSGSPLSIMAEMCAEAGMAWTVDHFRRDPLLEVFWPGLQRDTPWPVLDLTRSLDLDGYYNHVIVLGAEKADGSGERYRGEAIDHWEQRNIAHREPKTIQKPEYASDEECQQVAEVELEKALGQRTLSASATTTPALTSAVPGLYYRLRSLEGKGITDDGAAYLPLTKTHYTESQGEAQTDLEFEDSTEEEDLLRSIVRDGLDVGGLKRAERAYDQEPPGGWNTGYNRSYNGD